MKVEDRARILKRIAVGRAWLRELASCRTESTEAIAIREGLSDRAVRMTLSLAMLSPVVVQAVAGGRLPRSVGLTRLAELPASWAEQQEALHFGA